MLQYEENAIFRALGDATRRTMLERLDAGPSTVGDLAGPLDVSLTAATQHVRVLERAGLVTSQKIGRSRVCSLDRGAIGVAERWLADRRHRWERRLDALEAHLDATASSDPGPRGEPKR